LDGIEFTRENWVRFAKFGLGRHARSINDTAFGLFFCNRQAGSPFLFGRLRRRTPGPPPFSPMNSTRTAASSQIGAIRSGKKLKSREDRVFLFMYLQPFRSAEAREYNFFKNNPVHSYTTRLRWIWRSV
jgi:hypothetical protein